MEAKRNRRSLRRQALVGLALCGLLFISGLMVVDNNVKDMLRNEALGPIIGIDRLDGGNLKLYLFGEELGIDTEGIKGFIALVIGWMDQIKDRAISGL
jgi:hypothetical protein